MADNKMSPPDTSNYSQTISAVSLPTYEESEASTSNKTFNEGAATLTEAPSATCVFPGPFQISYTTDITEHVYSKDVKDPTSLPGNCGLYNLGNTCFMNSGLQSLLASDQLVKYCLEVLVLSPELQDTLLGRFKMLVTKIWSGEYSVIYPREFKDTLSLYHNQFQDYRQHDCQEFLALLLDSLHEQLLMTTQHPAITDQSKTSFETDKIDLSQSDTLTQCSTDLSSHLNNKSSHWTGALDMTQSESMDISQSNNVIQSHLDQPDSIFLEPEIREGKLNSKQTVMNEKDSDSTGSSTVTVSNISLLSEDSNQSTVSLHSSDSEHANTFKTLNIKTESSASASIEPELDVVAIETSAETMTTTQSIIAQNNTSPSKSSATHSVENREVDTKNIIQSNSPNKNVEVKLNNTRITSLASLEEYYSKDCKTLNTNMLIDDVLNNVNIDSDKFAKMDNRSRTETQVNVLEEVETEEEEKSEKCEGFGIKDTNLRADKKSRTACAKNMPLCEEEVYSDIKRFKIDQNEAEKNVQMEAMQKFRKNKSNIRDDLSRRSATPDSLMEVEGESSDEEGEVTSRSSTVDDIPSVPPVLESYSESDEQEADKAWDDYIAENNSVVVNSFQGQFKSTIVCSECSHISVTFEPFMYLSLPIPRALERQICVILMRPECPPTRYLLSMFKTDNVAKVRKQIKDLIHLPDSDIIIAEVLDCHISRLLDDNILLRYVNDSTRKIYAFEMTTPEKLPELPPSTVAMETTVVSTNQDTDYSIPPIASDPGDIFSSMGTFSTTAFDKSGNRSYNSKSQSSSDLSISQSGFISGPETAGTGMWEWTAHDARINPLPGPSWSDNIYDQPIGPAPRSSPVSFPSATSTDGATSMCGIADQWKSCAICLEEYADSALLIHSSCGGTFCDNCLEMSMKHSSDNVHCCPTCQSPANKCEDFLPLASSNGHKPASRILAIPVCQRYMKDGEPTLFNHPHIVYLPSSVTGQSLYSIVNTVLPPGLVYSVLLTDGQGKHCSRCQYTDHCKGCVMCREGEITLQPGDHLAVEIEEPDQIIDSLVDHVTMNDLRPDEPTTIYDCFTAFTQCEVLDEQNPWYCPQCRKNQCANKRMTVWRYPETLIVHLKRFVFHEFSSTKIDNPVIFPQKNLDLTDFLSGPKNTDLQYDLYSVVCHFGGSNSGHYTAYSKHPIYQEWYYYNDETVTKQTPKQDEYSSGYVLFYQKQGSGVKITPPVKHELNDIAGAVGTSVTKTTNTTTLSNQIAATATTVESTTTSEDTSDSQHSFDFYS